MFTPPAASPRRRWLLAAAPLLAACPTAPQPARSAPPQPPPSAAPAPPRETPDAQPSAPSPEAEARRERARRFMESMRAGHEWQATCASLGRPRAGRLEPLAPSDGGLAPAAPHENEGATGGSDAAHAVAGGPLSLALLRGGCEREPCEGPWVELRFENRGTTPVALAIQPEPAGGTWEPSLLLGSMSYPNGGEGAGPLWLATAGNDAGSAPLRLAPRGSFVMRTRLDWSGTGSVPLTPLLPLCVGPHVLTVTLRYAVEGAWFLASARGRFVLER